MSQGESLIYTLNGIPQDSSYFCPQHLNPRRQEVGNLYMKSLIYVCVPSLAIYIHVCIPKRT